MRKNPGSGVPRGGKGAIGMTGMPSWQSLFAAVLYAVVAGIGWRAGADARLARREADMRFWAGIAAVFVLLASSRILAAEDWLRDGFREAVRMEHLYEQRTALQVPLVLAVSLAAGWLGWKGAALWRLARSAAQRMKLLALFGVCAMLVLVALRLVSWHALDALLYAPWRLNWFIDMGATGLTGWAAWRYRQLRKAAAR